MSSDTAYTKKAVHFGSGAIGRGFVGLFLHQAGYEVVFVDVNENMVKQINEEGKYTVTEIGADGRNDVVVDHIRAIHSVTNPDSVKQEIATADIVTCAVGVRILKFIAPLVAQGINQRDTNLTPLTVIACENAMDNTATLLGHVKDGLNAEVLNNLNDYARFANCAVDRIVPDQHGASGLDIQIEAFYEWVVETPPFKDMEPPAIPAIKYVPDLAPYITRKLYTVNTAHATAAYHGRRAGYKTIAETMKDSHMRDLTRGSITESAKFIVDEYKIPEEEQAAYVEKIISRISNPALEDPVDRVGRAPLRKLGRNERLIGPAAALAERGWDYRHLLFAIEQALWFLDVEKDEESHQLALQLHTKKPDELVKEICGLTTNDKLYPEVLQVVSKVQEQQKNVSTTQATAAAAHNPVVASI